MFAALKKVLRLKAGIHKNINELLKTIFGGWGPYAASDYDISSNIFLDKASIHKNDRKNNLRNFLNITQAAYAIKRFTAVTNSLLL